MSDAEHDREENDWLWRAFLKMWQKDPKRVLQDLDLCQGRPALKLKLIVAVYAGELREKR